MNTQEHPRRRQVVRSARLLVTGEMVEAAMAVTGPVDQPGTCLYTSTLRAAIEAALAVAPFDIPRTTDPYPGRTGHYTKLIEVRTDPATSGKGAANE